MSKKKITVICAAVLFICAVTGGFIWSGMKTTAMGTGMALDVSSGTVDRDGEIKVKVTASSGMSMSYVDAFLSYDPELLELVDTSSDMATGGDGTIHIMENLDYGISEKTYELTFKALELGTCDFSLYDIYIEEFDTLDLLNLDGQSASVEVVMNTAVSEDARLQELSVADTDLDKTFNPDTFIYDLEVSMSMDTLVFSSVPMDENSTVKVPEDLSLAIGQNVIVIEVTAPAGNTQVYTLNVTRLDYDKETESESESESETETETETETGTETETETESVLETESASETESSDSADNTKATDETNESVEEQAQAAMETPAEPAVND